MQTYDEIVLKEINVNENFRVWTEYKYEKHNRNIFFGGDT